MDTPQVVVTLAGVLLVGFILWFFFGKRTATASRTAGGVQEAQVEVRGGYSPDRIEVEAGRPVRLTFVRKETNPCTEQVILPDFGIVRDLPVGRPTAVEFTPAKAGEFEFHCGMNMVRGRVIATSPAGPRP